MGIPVIVGITGLPRSGKDTVADFLIAKHPGTYKYSFAEPIVNMLNAGFNQDFRSDYWTERKKEPIPLLGKSPRELMQTLGTEWGRHHVHPDLWVFLAAQRFIQTGDGMIIPDVRFENEADFVRKRGGVIIHVVGIREDRASEHDSDSGVRLELGDLRVSNSGDLSELQHTVEGLFDVS